MRAGLLNKSWHAARWGDGRPPLTVALASFFFGAGPVSGVGHGMTFTQAVALEFDAVFSKVRRAVGSDIIGLRRSSIAPHHGPWPASLYGHLIEYTYILKTAPDFYFQDSPQTMGPMPLR